MTGILALADRDLACLADPATTSPAHRGLLRRATRSLRLTRLVVLARQLEEEAPQLVERSGFGPAMAVLRSLDAGELGTVVDHPYFGAWLAEAHALVGRDAHRRLAGGHVDAHLGRLAPFAVGATVAAGGRCRLQTRLSATAVLPIVPGHLALLFPFDVAGVEVSVEVERDGVRVSPAGGRPVAEYDLASTRVVAGSGTVHRMPVVQGLAIDAVSDERRHGADPRAFLGLSCVDGEAWGRATAGGMACLAAASEALLADVTATTSVLVPLASPDQRTVRNHTSSAMFGLVASSLPSGDAALAEVLVHETQHSKLHVIESMASLVTDGTEDLCSPWRPDARPAIGVLHGAYSFAAVAELWAALAAFRDGKEREQAAADAVHRREQVLEAVTTLRRSGRLTGPGREFVDEVERRADALRTLDRWVPLADLQRGEQALVDHRAQWRARRGPPPLRSQAPRRAAPAPAVAEVLAGLGVGSPVSNVAGSRDIRCDPSMRKLGQLRVLEQASFERVASAVERLGDEAGPVVRGHVAYVRRDFDTALDLYRAALAEDAHDLDRWADLAFCLRQLGRFDESTAILARLDELAGAGTALAVPS